MGLSESLNLGRYLISSSKKKKRSKGEKFLVASKKVDGMYACKGFTCYQNYELAQLDYSAPKRAPKNPVKFHAKRSLLSVCELRRESTTRTGAYKWFSG